VSALKKAALLCVFLAIAFSLILRSSALYACFWANAGSIALSRAVVAASDESGQRALGQAETLLKRAAACDPPNRFVWRGLGFVLAAQGHEEEALAAWARVDGMAEELLLWGEKAREAGDFEEALVWYEWVAELKPRSGDLWYQSGVAYEELGRLEEALAAFEKADSLPLVEIGQSDVLCKIGWLRANRVDPPDPVTALATYDQALALDQFTLEWRRVQTHFYRGETLQQLDLFEDAITEYERVVVLQPGHYWARVHLGMLYWQVRGDAESAEVMLEAAALLQYENKWAFRGLAQVYQEMGRDAEAIALFKWVLHLDPQDRMAQKQLEKLNPVEND
jgi:tetratricopeptide (TPR) repeat protein